MRNIKDLFRNETSRQQCWLFAAFLPAMLVLWGCGHSGPAFHTLSGKVTFQGRPVDSGRVRLSAPETGFDVMAEIQEGGFYNVKTAKGDGLPEGVYQVAVEPPRIDVPIGTIDPPPHPIRRDIPEKYRRPATSGLSVTIKAGDNAFDIHMSPGK